MYQELHPSIIKLQKSINLIGKQLKRYSNLTLLSKPNAIPSFAVHNLSMQASLKILVNHLQSQKLASLPTD